MADFSVTIAGKLHKLRYRLEQRDEIEQRASNGTTRALLEVIVSGSVRDQATVVWGGIKGAKPDTKMTPRGLIEEFQRHQEKGGDYYQDIVCPAFMAVCESKLLGDANAEEFKRLIGFKAKVDAEGKDEGAAEAPDSVKAQE